MATSNRNWLITFRGCNSEEERLKMIDNIGEAVKDTLWRIRKLKSWKDTHRIKINIEEQDNGEE